MHRDADCVYGRSPAEGARSPRLIRPEETTVVSDDSGIRVTRLFGPEVTEHLLCQETVLERGTWAFEPLHRHDRTDPPALEEVSYCRTSPEDGWGLQALFVPDESEPLPFVVRNGDAVVVRGGEYPLVAGPTTRLYVLTYMAGPEARLPE